jgi:hypothetical protein
MEYFLQKKIRHKNEIFGGAQELKGIFRLN